jgi:hypothetical protein
MASVGCHNRHLKLIVSSFQLPSAIVINNKDAPFVTPLDTPKHHAMLIIHPAVISKSQFLIHRPTNLTVGSAKLVPPDLTEAAPWFLKSWRRRIARCLWITFLKCTLVALPGSFAIEDIYEAISVFSPEHEAILKGLFGREYFDFIEGTP